MTLVASAFVWSQYPGLRAGRIYTGKPDITRLPTGETHVVDGPGTDETRCGLPRAGFTYEFPDGTAPDKGAEFCPTCRS